LKLGFNGFGVIARTVAVILALHFAGPIIKRDFVAAHVHFARTGPKDFRHAG
jgi:hypothetical protein